MTLFFKKTTNDEMDLIQLYLKKPFLLHMMVLAAGAAAPLVFILKSGFQQHPLPARAAYPFSIEPFWVRALLSGSHFIVAIQVIAAINSTMLFVIPTWFAAARFEIVGMNIKKATNENEVKICLRRHQESLDYANRLAATVGRMAFGVAASNFLGVIFGGLVITYKQFYSIDFIHVILFITIAMVHLFLYAWPADHLTQSSIRVSESIFYGQWIGKPPRMHSSILIMMLRANDPVVIKVDGLLPALNVESFGVGLSSSFSYVATLLAILGQ